MSRSVCGYHWDQKNSHTTTPKIRCGRGVFSLLVVILCLGRVDADADPCASACVCLGSMVDCSKQGLTSVPDDLPSWTLVLDLQSNGIEEIHQTAFGYLTNLEKLDLSENLLTEINTTVFTGLPSLKELLINKNSLTSIPVIDSRDANLTLLSLEQNYIESIPVELLASQRSLETLNLNSNHLSELSADMFPSGNVLRELFLNKNQLGGIDPGTFDNATSLEWLKLNKNRLSVIPKNLFRHLRQLKYLELSRNRIRDIDGLSFHGLESLLVLKLRRNLLTGLMDGAFWGLSSIQELQLDDNNITAINKGWLYGLSTLEQLSLSHNSIAEIDSDGWEFCEILWKMDLTYNKLHTLRVMEFQKLHNLRYLYLDHNHLSNIEDQAFVGLSSLESLELNNNLISWTIEDMNGAFDGLESLMKLGLSGNKIKSVARRAFNTLTNLRHLDLSHNAIMSIQSNAFAGLDDLQQLNLNTSSLLCDCQLRWLPPWLDDTGFRSVVQAKCSHPEWLSGRDVFDITADEFTCADFPKPYITLHPETMVALRYDNVSMMCSAASTSDSPMTFTWKKDSKELLGSDISTFAHETESDIMEFTTTLRLWNVQDYDEGRYQCVISNRFGSSYSEKARVTVHVFPSFLKIPDDITVRSGSTARLECAATGLPFPQIAWQKDGGIDFPAARERRMHVMPTDDVFFIVNVKTADMGTYSCTAQNAAGMIMANSTLTVLETPSFVKPLIDQTIRVGETAVLECMSSGSPPPRLRWLKDGKPLRAIERHFFTADSQLLVIIATQQSDAGEYTCELSNTVGTERDTATLVVKQAAQQDSPQRSSSVFNLDNTSTATGIIIIVVVCCVVGTSLVWVIIIYHTRKRREEYSAANTEETTLPPDIPSSFHLSSQGTVSSQQDSSSSRSNSSQNIHHSASGSSGQRRSCSLSDCERADSPVTVGGVGLRIPTRLRTAAIFPSDEMSQQTIPLTSDEQKMAENSGSSLITVPMPENRCVNDTLTSSTPKPATTLSTFSHAPLPMSAATTPSPPLGHNSTSIDCQSPLNINNNRDASYDNLYPVFKVPKEADWRSYGRHVSDSYTPNVSIIDMCSRRDSLGLCNDGTVAPAPVPLTNSRGTKSGNPSPAKKPIVPSRKNSADINIEATHLSALTAKSALKMNGDAGGPHRGLSSTSLCSSPSQPGTPPCQQRHCPPLPPSNNNTSTISIPPTLTQSESIVGAHSTRLDVEPNR